MLALMLDLMGAQGNAGIIQLFLAGATAGAAAAGLVTPADVVKTRVQVQDSRYHSIRHCAVSVWKEEGFGAFWKGVFPRMSVQVFLRASSRLHGSLSDLTVPPSRQRRRCSASH